MFTSMKNYSVHTAMCNFNNMHELSLSHGFYTRTGFETQVGAWHEYILPLSIPASSDTL